jgi:1,4-dihydroxy-2-naphthoate octaprenyltransferase
MSSIKNLIYASRLRTLPLACSCAIVAGAMAYYVAAFDGIIFSLSLLTIVLLQVLSNFANDLGDSQKGTDNEHRIGPERAVQKGLISMQKMDQYVKILTGLAFLSGLMLLFFSNMLLWQKMLFIALGIAAIAAAKFYTMGKMAYGYRGYGDIFVFLFFGIVGVVGSLFLYIHVVNLAALLPAVGVGLLSVAVLHLNNMRDVVNDLQSGKMTLAIRLGHENSKLYFLFLIVGGIFSWGFFPLTQTWVHVFSYIYYIGFIPLFYVLFIFFKIKEAAQYDKLMKPLALSVFLISLLFFVSQIF